MNVSEEMYKFTGENTAVYHNNLYMRFCGVWYVMDLDVSNVERIKDGYGLRYQCDGGYVKSLTWDLDNSAIRVRVHKKMQFDKEYLLTLETVEDFSDYVTSTYGNIKKDIQYLDSGKSAEAIIWDLLTSINVDQ